MKVLLILFLIALIILIWAKLFPDKKITIQAEHINKLSSKLFSISKVWGDDRLQTIRIKRDLNDYLNLKIQNCFFAGDLNKYRYMQKQCHKLLIISLKHKRHLVIPCGSQSQGRWFADELTTLIKNDLNYFFPSLHWNEPTIKRIKATSYFYFTVSEK